MPAKDTNGNQNDGYIRFRCQGCGKRLKIRKTFEGGSVIPCPVCRASVVTPLANLEAIANRGKYEEIAGDGGGWLDSLNVMPDVLRDRLAPAGHGRANGGAGDVDVGGGPTLKQGRWTVADSAFSRILALDRATAGIVKIDNDYIGRVQTLYRDKDLDAAKRTARFEKFAERRRADLAEMFKNTMAATRRELAPLAANHERLSTEELHRMERLQIGIEALQLYARNMYGVDI